MNTSLIRILRGGIKYAFDADYRWCFNAHLGKYNDLLDEEYLKKFYKAKMGYELNLSAPKRFNEKLQWLKLYDRKPLYTTMVDKYAVREYVSSLIGSEHVIPLLAVWDSPDEMRIDDLPEQFVLKTTHGCGGMYICRDKAKFDLQAAKKALNKAFSKNYYYSVREWPYKDVVPRVIAEEYVQNGDAPNLTVYKVFNFGGRPTIIQTVQNDKTPNETIDYFDTEWNLLDLKQNYPNSECHLDKPSTLNEILRLSEICSQGFPFLRTDWYEVNGKVLFSEFTFFSDAGMERFYPDEWDFKLGDMIYLPEKQYQV